MISTGYVIDKSTINDEKGNFRFTKCPFTNIGLELQTFPAINLKAKITSWLENKFRIILVVLEYYSKVSKKEGFL